MLRASLDPRPQLPPVLVAARAVMDRRRPRSTEDPQGDRVRALHAVRELVLHLVAVDAHPREVRLGELHLVEVDEGEALGPGPLDERDEVRLPFGDQGHLESDDHAEGPREAGRGDEGAGRGARPEARRHVEPDLVEAGVGERADLLRIRRHRVQVRVERRSEFRLQDPDIVGRPLDRVERIPARDPRAGRADRAGLLEDVLVAGDALLVREDDVPVHLLVGNRAVEAVEGAQARHEEDHLRAVRALAASDREGAAGEPTERTLFEAHAPPNRPRGIKVRARAGRVGRAREPSYL